MAESKEEKKKLCPDCEKEIAADASRCPECGFAVKAYEEFDRMARVRSKHAKPAKKQESKSFLDDIFS